MASSYSLRPVNFIQRIASVLILFFLVYSLSSAYGASKYNGFKLKDSLIPKHRIHHGGPQKDGIPALINPYFIKAQDNHLLKDSDRVLALSYGGINKAYPIRILDYHELVNDSFNDKPVLISFCPLCGTGMAFDAVIEKRRLHFGVSGLLYNSDVLMYDLETESLWSQIMQKAVSGEMKGTQLNMLPLEHTTWGLWRKQYPDSLLLSFKTGHRRNYFKTLYKGYKNKRQLYFPVTHEDKRYHPKEVVIGVTIGETMKAYPFVELSRTGKPLHDTIEDRDIVIQFDQENRTARVTDSKGMLMPSLTAFWFAWYAFNPKTEVYKYIEDESDL